MYESLEAHAHNVKHFVPEIYARVYMSIDILKWSNCTT